MDAAAEGSLHTAAQHIKVMSAMSFHRPDLIRSCDDKILKRKRDGDTSIKVSMMRGETALHCHLVEDADRHIGHQLLRRLSGDQPHSVSSVVENNELLQLVQQKDWRAGLGSQTKTTADEVDLYRILDNDTEKVRAWKKLNARFYSHI
jgi:hypothetical protein